MLTRTTPDEGHSDQLVAETTVEDLTITGPISGDLTLTGATVRGCVLTDVIVEQAHLERIRLLDSQVSRADLPVLNGLRGTWKDVRLRHSRIGSAELFGSRWHRVHLVDCKLGYLNLRGASVQDVLLTGCTVDELDLGEAELSRVALADTSVSRLDLHRSRLADVDLRGAELREINGLPGLRGATVSEEQLQLLAPLLAAELGISVA